MPTAAHDLLVMTLAERPELLGELFARLRRRSLPSLRTVDSTIRLGDEVRPDLLLNDESGRWLAVEVQLGLDPEKLRRWPLLASALLNHSGIMGDIVVITPIRHVARWAEHVAAAMGLLGTRLRLRPVVLWLGETDCMMLLDETRPELAFFAAWAMHARRGARARAIVRRALQLSERLPPELRENQVRAILRVLSRAMLAWLKEVQVDPEKVPETPWLREWRLELEGKGQIEGKRQALIAVVEARGLGLSAAERARIQACTDIAVIERWIARAATADSVSAIFDS